MNTPSTAGLGALGRIAQACHEINRIFSLLHGDESHAHWEETSQELRDSAIAGVRRALDGQTPEQLHESWKADKIAAGWVHGETKDETAKTHPCITDYANLPEYQRQKDGLFSGVAFLMASVMGILEPSNETNV